MDIFQNERHDRGGRLTHARNFTDYFCYKVVDFGCVLRNNLDTYIRLPNPTRNITYRIELNHLLCDIKDAIRFNFQPNICNGCQSKSLRSCHGTDLNYAFIHHTIDPVTDSTL